MKSSFAISNLSVSYGDRSVLHELSVDIPQGKVTTLIGPNGCGKSTLLNSLCGLMPYQGSIRTRRLWDYDLVSAPAELLYCLRVLLLRNI